MAIQRRERRNRFLSTPSCSRAETRSLRVSRKKLPAERADRLALIHIASIGALQIGAQQIDAPLATAIPLAVSVTSVWTAQCLLQAISLANGPCLKDGYTSFGTVKPSRSGRVSNSSASASPTNLSVPGSKFTVRSSR